MTRCISLFSKIATTHLKNSVVMSSLESSGFWLYSTAVGFSTKLLIVPPEGESKKPFEGVRFNPFFPLKSVLVLMISQLISLFEYWWIFQILKYSRIKIHYLWWPNIGLLKLACLKLYGWMTCITWCMKYHQRYSLNFWVHQQDF